MCIECVLNVDGMYTLCNKMLPKLSKNFPNKGLKIQNIDFETMALRIAKSEKKIETL